MSLRHIAIAEKARRSVAEPVAGAVVGAGSGVGIPVTGSPGEQPEFGAFTDRREGRAGAVVADRMLAPMVRSWTHARIGEFAFDPLSGELCRRGAGDRSGEDAGQGVDHEVVRLAPQPARLLELLVERDGELLSREEIREALWPETHVDFDQSLHFCVRQVRAAFGDDASSPRWIETLPRRGYRLMQPVERLVTDEPCDSVVATAEGRAIGDPSAERPPAPAGRGAHGRPLVSRTAAGLVLVSVVALAIAVLGWPDGSRHEARRPIRLAIMPFEFSIDEAARRSEMARLSEWLVAALANQGADLEVIGPRSTARFSAFPFPDLQLVRADLRADYLLNVRPLKRQSGSEDDADEAPEMLVELIDLDSGAHPWVRYFEAAEPWRDVAEQVFEGVSAVVSTSDLRPREPGP